ncbi:MAG: ATP-dependent metallopeptidase FtsH/Yme1/Tma family protein, partial [Streptosporangiaceae bacterium]
MSKQASPPPPGDKPSPQAPPPQPPAWRHWLLPIGLLVAVLLWTLLPLHSAKQTTLTYSQFLSDVSAHKVKTIDLASGSGDASSGTLTNGTNYTVTVPSQAGQTLLNELQSNNVQIT